MKLLLDNSARVRLDHRDLPDDRVIGIALAVEERRIVSARSSA